MIELIKNKLFIGLSVTAAVCDFQVRDMPLSFCLPMAGQMLLPAKITVAGLFILPKNSEDMARRTKGAREVRLIPGAGHAESAIRQPELYREYLYGFLDHVSERAGCEV